MRKGFTLIELAVVLTVVTLATGMLLVTQTSFGQDLDAAAKIKKRGDMAKETANLRNLHIAMVTFGTSNKDWFPGLTAAGGYVPAFKGRFYQAAAMANGEKEKAAGSGTTIAAGNNLAMAILLDDASITPAQLISQSEQDGGIDPAAPGAGGQATEITGKNISHALLAYGRFSLKQEWQANQNQQAIVCATRLIFGDKPGQYNSGWTDMESGKWRGVTVRGDSSAEVGNAAVGEFTNLKYGSRVVATTQTDTLKTAGIFGRSDDMKNFDATAETGMLGNARDVREK